jgi:hypothetical protein
MSRSSFSTGDETGRELLELVVARLLAELRVVVTEEPLRRAGSREATRVRSQLNSSFFSATDE